MYLQLPLLLLALSPTVSHADIFQADDASHTMYILSSNSEIPSKVPVVPKNAQELNILASSMPAEAKYGDVSVAALVGQPGFSPSSLECSTFATANVSSSEVTPSAFGTAGVSYSDSRFSDYSNPSVSSGKLFMKYPDQWWICSATLIGRSLLLTAAHCVFKFGTSTSAGFPVTENGQIQVYFAPAYKNGVAPYGVWWANAILVPTPYYRGTDTCSQRGMVCNNDIALIWLKLGGNVCPKVQAGVKLGYMGYGWNGYGFATPASAYSLFGTLPSSMMTQLGYPGAFDSGGTMQISNSPAYNYLTTSTTNGKQLKNFQRGTTMTGGSSGGAWIVNYGVDAVLSGTNYGRQAQRNIIMGVTSYGYHGYTHGDVKVQGACSFGQNNEYPDSAYGSRGAGNIGFLVWSACDSPAGWRLQERGMC